MLTTEVALNFTMSTIAAIYYQGLHTTNKSAIKSGQKRHENKTHKGKKMQ
jgi:hypothetical protein